MATPKVQLGILSTLYYNSGTFGTPVWVAVGLVGDLQVPAKWDVVELPIRASRVKFKNKTMIDVGITGKLLASGTDAAVLALMAAMLNDDVIDVMALNGTSATNGAKGFRFEAQVVNATEDQGTGVVVFEDFELIPVYTANPPKSVIVTTGAPVFTTLGA